MRPISIRLFKEVYDYDLLYRISDHQPSPPGSTSLILHLPSTLHRSFAVIEAWSIFYSLLNHPPKLVPPTGSRSPLSFLASTPPLSPLFDTLLFSILPVVKQKDLFFRSFLVRGRWVLVLKDFGHFNLQSYDYFGWNFPLSIAFPPLPPSLLSFFRLYFHSPF